MAFLALRRTCVSWREITMTATLESFTPHQPTSPAQPFDQDDHEAIIFQCVERYLTVFFFWCVALVDQLTNAAVFCMIWTHSLKVPSASTPCSISIKWSRPTRIDQIHRHLMTLPNYVQKTNSKWTPTDGSDRPGGIGVTEPPPARGARSNVLDICFQELQVCPNCLDSPSLN